MRSAHLLFALLLAAAAASPAGAAPAMSVGGPGAEDQGGGVDWLLQRAERVFTSDNTIYGEVHLPVIASNPNAGNTYGDPTRVHAETLTARAEAWKTRDDGKPSIRSGH